MKHQALKTLEAAERKAWSNTQRGSEVDACTLYGKEGRNYLAWCAAADACNEYRKQNGLLGLSWREIKLAA